MTLIDHISKKNSLQIQVFELLDGSHLQAAYPDFYRRLDDLDLEHCPKNDLLDLSKDAPTVGSSLYLLGKHLQRSLEHRI